MKVCSVNDCNKKIIAKSLCSAHYRRLRIHGDINYLENKRGLYKTAEECFDNNFFIDPILGCWLWTGTTSLGYGLICYKGKAVKAHRYSYEKYIGTIEKSMVICHKCDNPKCVNPDHLFMGTQKDNMYDCFSKKRHPGFPKEKIPYGEKNGHAKLTDEKVKEILILIKDGFKNIEISKKYGVFKTAISAIRNNRTWKHVLRE